MTITPIEDVAFDDAATLAMGEAFDRTCESIRIIGSTVPVREIIAKQIIDAAKNGERDPTRLYEQALIIFGIVDLSKLLISVGDPPSQPTLRSRTQRDPESPVRPEPGFLLWPPGGEPPHFKLSVHAAMSANDPKRTSDLKRPIVDNVDWIA